MKLRLPDFHCLGLLFFLAIEFLMNSGSKTSPKGLRLSTLVWTYVKRLTFHVRTADITYCADETLFLHATSGGLPSTEAFCLCWFLGLYCFKINLASISRYKTMYFYSTMYVSKSFIIVNKSIKETKNLSFQYWDQILFHSWAPKLAFSLMAIATAEKTTFGVHSVT